MKLIMSSLAVGLLLLAPTNVDAELRGEFGGPTYVPSSRGSDAGPDAFALVGAGGRGGARRKRLEGSKSLKGGNALPSIEDLEKEFEAVSFGDLFFGRALEEELSMSYSFSYGYSSSMSYSYSTSSTSSLSASSSSGLTGDSPLEGIPNDPAIDDAPAVVATFNRFACGPESTIVLEEGASVGDDAEAVEITYTYSFQTTSDDPNTVYLIEAAILGTIVSTLLDCSGISTVDNRALATASAISTTFSTVNEVDGSCVSTYGSDATSCSRTISSDVEFFLEDGPSPQEAIESALRSIKDAMDGEEYSIPTVTTINYLGPNLLDGTELSNTLYLDGTKPSEVTLLSVPNMQGNAITEDAQSSGISSMTQAGIALMSVGGVVLVGALLRRRRIMQNRHEEHIRLKDDGSRDGDGSFLTADNTSQNSPPRAGTRVGAHPERSLEAELA